VTSPFHRIEEFVPLTPEAITRLSLWKENRRVGRRLDTIRREGDPVGHVYFLIGGWVSSSLLMSDGRRQIVKIHLPGDMLGFPSLALEKAGETLDALTDIEFCAIPAVEIGQLFEQYPAVAAGLFLSAQKERVALMQELSWVGSSSSLGRLAAFLLDLYHRLDAAGMVTNQGFDWPLTQTHLGELLGMTAIHTNRMFRQLDKTGYIAREGRHIRVIDMHGLRSLTPSMPPPVASRVGWERLGCPGKS
jgi:CRP/FNR family transcriptional regulator